MLNANSACFFALEIEIKGRVLAELVEKVLPRDEISIEKNVILNQILINNFQDDSRIII
jgi:hypothetical protein